MNQYQHSSDPPPILMQVKSYVNTLRDDQERPSRHLVIAVVMTVALFAFELFNFDTTRYALDSLIGNASFLSLSWAVILAIAFCSIDFAGLIRMFTPENDANERKEVYYLMGAWLLGATMNAVMTWWAVSLTLLEHQFGNEVLSREVLLKVVPVFVAVLVWLTRILFIGALSVTGEQLISYHRRQRRNQNRRAPAMAQPRNKAAIKERPAGYVSRRPQPVMQEQLVVESEAPAPRAKTATRKPRSSRKRQAADTVVQQEPLVKPTSRPGSRPPGPPRRTSRSKEAVRPPSDKSYEASQRN